MRYAPGDEEFVIVGLPEHPFIGTLPVCYVPPAASEPLDAAGAQAIKLGLKRNMGHLKDDLRKLAETSSLNTAPKAKDDVDDQRMERWPT